MNKKTFLRTILSLCFVIFFNIIFFGVVKKEPPASVWISYVFVHISYLSVLAVSFLTTKGKSRDVYGLSLYAISGTYFIAELLTGLLFVFLRMESFKASLVVQLLLLVAFFGFFVTGMLANEETSESEMKHES